jgi:CHAD domain-containing protein
VAVSRQIGAEGYRLPCVTVQVDPEMPALLRGSSGSVAAALIDARLRRLVALQNEVLADRDPEPLHQMRVSFRRLRSTLEQFAPALCLPDAADPRRVARIARRLGLARDLDVLRRRLDVDLVPLLPERELEPLKPLFKQLRRERRLAFEELRDCLQGRRYLKLLAKLQGWLKQPVFTPLGEEPLLAWRSEWLQACLAGLTTLPGWWASNPYDPTAIAELHGLRRRIKRARYGLSNLRAVDPDRIGPWLARLRQLQGLLGDLNDLQLIDAALHRQLDGSPDQLLPALCSLMAEQRVQAWQQWQVQAEPLRSVEGRAEFHSLALIQA